LCRSSFPRLPEDANQSLCRNSRFLRHYSEFFENTADCSEIFTRIASGEIARLLQLRVLGFRRDEHRNICIRSFPEREEVLIRGAGFRGVALHGISAGETKVR
jgi:hypothetical protein